MHDAGDTLEILQRAGVNLVLSGHKHVPYAWRLEDLFVVNAGTVSSMRAARAHAALLQRGRDLRRTRSTSTAATRSTAARRSSASRTQTLAYEKHLPPAPGRPMTRAHAGAGRRRALSAGGARRARARRARTAEVVAALLLGGPEKLAGDARLRRAAGAAAAIARPADALVRRPAATAPTACSTYPTSRCWASDARMRLAAHAVAAGLAYARPRLRASGRRRWNGRRRATLAVIGTGKRIGKTAVSGARRPPAARGAAATWWSWRWAAAARPSRSWSTRG